MRLYRHTFAASLIVAVLIPNAASAAGDAEKGRALAIEHCSRCHVVGDHNPMGGIGSTPSFQLLKTLDDWRERFETFYARRSHPVHVRIEGLPKLTQLPPNAAPFTIKPVDVGHILAFVEGMPPR